MKDEDKSREQLIQELATLRQSEVKYRTLLENIPQKIFYKNRDSVYVTVNPSYARDFSLLPDDFVGKSDYDIYPGSLAEKYRADDQRVIQQGVPVEMDECYVFDGEERAVHTIKVPVRSDGNIIGVLGIFWDITERKRSEEALFRAKEEWEKTFDAIPDLICILDEHHRIVRINKAMSDRLGLSKEQCLGAPCFSVVHGTQTPPENCPHVQTLKDGNTHMVEVEEGNVRGWFMVTTSPLTDTAGKVIGSVHVARDITFRKTAEEEREKLVAELQDALSKVKLLSGLLPICAWCKKIRDDKGYWRQIESYLHDHSEAEFSHGICPDCVKKLYPKLRGSEDR